MFNLKKISESSNEILDVIEKSSEGTNLFGGNCGFFALFLADKFKKYNPEIVFIFSSLDSGIENKEDLVSPFYENELNHVMVKINGEYYDGGGKASPNDWIFPGSEIIEIGFNGNEEFLKKIVYYNTPGEDDDDS